MVQGVVLRGDRFFIPRGLRKEMIEKAHEGHLGIAKTKARAREHVVAGNAKSIGRDGD